MGDRAEKAYLQPYRVALKRFGPGFKATLWNSPETQALRFDVMIDLAGLDGASVLDVGCGRGDFAAHLIDREVPFSAFVGVDALPEMVEAASGRALPRCRFLHADAVADPAVLTTGAPDFVCFSGTLNTMSDETARQLVCRAYEAAAQGVVFNFLSTRAHRRFADRDTTPARRFDPLKWLDFALGLSSRVAFTQAYLDGHDATILIAHDE